MNSEEDPTYNSSKDEHAQMLIGKNIKLCQDSMKVLIGDIDKKAEKAHERIDDVVEKFGTRLGRLDDEQTGKVTAMWEDRKYVRNSVRNTLFTLIGALLLSLVLQYIGQVNVSRNVTDVAIRAANIAQEVSRKTVESALQEQIKQLKNNGGVIK